MLWHKGDRLDDEYLVVEMLRELRREIPVMGSKRIHQMLAPTLAAHNIKLGWNRLHEIRIRYRLLVIRRRRYISTTDSRHRFRKYSNLIKDLEVAAPSKLWVSDITYITVGDTFHFLSLITDAYSRYIVGYCLYHTLEAKGPLEALAMALKSLDTKAQGLIHHSDRGIQYCCDAYTQILCDKGIEISMTENGDPYQNAIAERVNGVLKDNYDLKRQFDNGLEAKGAIISAIQSYNYRRPHGSIDNMTPAQAHQKIGKLKKHWKPKVYKRNASGHDPALPV
jgi:putative transposase